MVNLFLHFFVVFLGKFCQSFQLLLVLNFCLGLLFGIFLTSFNLSLSSLSSNQTLQISYSNQNYFFGNSNSHINFGNKSHKLAELTGIGDSTPECGEKTISIAAIITPGSFFPVIPCAYNNETKEIQPLSPALIPDIMIRAFGMIASLTFYLFFGVLILSGVMFVWDGINGNSRKQAERNIYDTIYALILIFGTYTILMTILSLLNFSFEKTRVQFFSFGS